jgi:lipopolysaccharide transport system permease protein
MRSKQTVIGVASAAVQPLLAMAVFTVVFCRIAKLPSDGSAPFIASARPKEVSPT